MARLGRRSPNRPSGTVRPTNVMRVRPPAAPVTGPFLVPGASAHATADGTFLDVAVTCAVGDQLICIHGNDANTLADMTAPTATGQTFAEIVNARADGGTNGVHLKAWTTVAAATSITVRFNQAVANDIFAAVLPTRDDLGTPIVVDDSANGSGTTQTNHLAPSVDPATNTDDLAIWVWLRLGVGVYTLPGGAVVELYQEADAVSSFARIAVGTEKLADAAATGTRTATTSSSTYVAHSIALRSPTVGAVSGVGAVPQRSTTTDTTRKQAVGAGVASSRTSTTSTGIKGVSRAGAVDQRSTTVDTTRKQALGVGAPTGHTSTADTVVKKATGAGASTGHNLTQSTGGSGGAVGSGTASQRTATTATTVKTGLGTGRPGARTTTTSTGIKNAAASGVPAARTATTGTVRKQSTGTGAASAHPVTQAATAAIVGGPGSAVAHPLTSATGKRSATTTTATSQRTAVVATGKRTAVSLGRPTGRSHTAASGAHGGAGVGRSEVHAVTLATGLVVPAYVPAYVGLDASTTVTGQVGGGTRVGVLEGTTTTGAVLQ